MTPPPPPPYAPLSDAASSGPTSADAPSSHGAVIAAMAETRILVIGDVMLDRFIAGHIGRISPEAPVPVLSLDGEANMPGGAGNVARNLAHLGCRVDLIGIIGTDSEADALLNAIKTEAGIKFHAITDRMRPTTTKSRYTAAGQQILRVDREETAPIPGRIAARVLKTAERCLPHADIVIISDYNKGVITPDMAKKLITMARRGRVPILADPKKSDAGIFARANLITPNMGEAQAMSGARLNTADALGRAVHTMARTHKIDHILTTMSGAGMMLCHRDGRMRHIPAMAQSVFDVSGAGDTVIAAMAGAMAAGAVPFEAMEIANTAAGVVVGKAGTATAGPGEILAEMVARRIPDKATSLDMIAAWHKQGAVIGFTNGCFDCLHPGHLEVLQAAAKTCTRLVVGVNSDASARRLKGAGRPFQDENTRAAILMSLPMVDAVIIFDEATPARLIRAIRPHRLIKGGDYDPMKVVGRKSVLKDGGKVIIVPLREGYSTTRLSSTPLPLPLSSS